MAEDFGENEGMERLFGASERQKPIAKNEPTQAQRLPKIESASVAGLEKKPSVVGRNVPAPIEEEKPMPAKKSENKALGAAETVAAGIVLGEVGEAVVNAGAKIARGVVRRGIEEIKDEIKRRTHPANIPTTREGKRIREENIKKLELEREATLKGDRSGPPNEPPSGGKPPENKNGNENDPIKSAVFAKVMSMSNDTTISSGERQKWVTEKEARIDEFNNFDQGDFVADTMRYFQTIMRTSEWDSEGGKGVYDRLTSYSENRDREYQGRHESDPKLRGLIGIAIRSEAARVLVAGIENKFGRMGGEGEMRAWLKSKNYTMDEVNRLARLAEQNHIFDFGTDAPEELVGASIKDEEVESLKPPTPEPGTVHGGMPFNNMEDFARAMGVASPEQQRALYLRAEEKIFPIPAMDLEVPKFLLAGRNEREFENTQEEWIARVRLNNAAAFKRMSPSYDKVFPNQDMIDFSKSNLKVLLTKPGVVEAASLYTKLIVDSQEINKLTGERKDLATDPNNLLNTDESMEDLGLVDSIFNVRSSEQMSDIRHAVQGWLVDKMEIDSEDAQDAEHIAWNLIYISNMVEEFDSKYKHPEIAKRTPPIIGTFKSLPVWMLMHPQERLEAKVGGKEAWSKAGEWALNKRRGDIPIVLPTEVFGNVLKEIKFVVGKERFTNREIEESLFDILHENGRKIASGNDVVRRGEDLDWEKASEGPFGGYCFDTISPSIAVLTVIDKGMQKDTAITKLGDAFRKLKIPKKVREEVLIIAHGLDPKSFSLKPSMGWMAWGDYVKGLKRYAPNLLE